MSIENALYFGDNLKILRDSIPPNSIDLIYLDPPFNSKASYNILFKEPSGEPSEAQITVFDDTWHWTAETQKTFEEIISRGPAEVAEMMTSFKKFVGPNDVMAYLTMMCIRLLELHKVLKDNGSMYLHCDPSASHYLKILLDTIFGKGNFQNEIVWHYRGGGVSRNRFGRRHDIILFYTKSNLPNTFNVDEVRVPYSNESLERLRYKARAFRGKKVYDSYQPHPLGKHPDDVWDIQPIMPSSKQRLGYPTQKPESLLEIIIKASSNENSIVLDPFCGCGTTIAAAHRLKRKWIGIDITYLAINLIKKRMNDMFGLVPKKDYRVIGEPEDLASAKELARQNRYQFQWWALSLVQAKPYKSKKKGADTGIDGLLYYYEGKTKIGRAIVQVKSGHNISVKDIRDLGHVIKRENSQAGIFITLEKPTKDMMKEAVTEGFFESESFGGKYPRLQILTLEDLFAGQKPKLPPLASVYQNAAKFIPDNQISF
jgi:site-specific DNA-methyltransferase (adenine-specific)